MSNMFLKGYPLEANTAPKKAGENCIESLGHTHDKNHLFICLETSGFPQFKRPFVWEMGNPTFLHQKSKKLGQFFRIEKLLDKFYE